LPPFILNLYLRHMQSAVNSFNQIKNYTPIKLCLLVFVLDFFVTVFFSVILFPEPRYGNNLIINSTAEKIFLFLLMAPLIETLFFQSFLCNLIYSKSKRESYAIIISALFFGLAHTYSLPYVIKAFIAGVLYSSLYLNLISRGYNGFLYTLFTHVFFNTIAFLFNEFN